MVIKFHMSLSLLRYQPNFKWGINARQRTKYDESFTQTYVQNGDTLSYLIGIESRGRTSPHHGHGWLHDWLHGCCQGINSTQICFHDCITRLFSCLVHRSHHSHHNRTIHLRVVRPAMIICGQVSHLISQNKSFSCHPVTRVFFHQVTTNSFRCHPFVTRVFLNNFHNFNGHLFMPQLCKQP